MRLRLLQRLGLLAIGAVLLFSEAVQAVTPAYSLGTQIFENSAGFQYQLQKNKQSNIAQQRANNLATDGAVAETGARSQYNMAERDLRHADRDRDAQVSAERGARGLERNAARRQVDEARQDAKLQGAEKSQAAAQGELNHARKDAAQDQVDESRLKPERDAAKKLANAVEPSAGAAKQGEKNEIARETRDKEKQIDDSGKSKELGQKAAKENKIGKEAGAQAARNEADEKALARKSGKLERKATKAQLAEVDAEGGEKKAAALENTDKATAKNVGDRLSREKRDTVDAEIKEAKAQDAGDFGSVDHGLKAGDKVKLQEQIKQDEKRIERRDKQLARDELKEKMLEADVQKDKSRADNDDKKAANLRQISRQDQARANDMKEKALHDKEQSEDDKMALNRMERAMGRDKSAKERAQARVDGLKSKERPIEEKEQKLNNERNEVLHDLEMDENKRHNAEQGALQARENLDEVRKIEEKTHQKVDDLKNEARTTEPKLDSGSGSSGKGGGGGGKGGSGGSSSNEYSSGSKSKDLNAERDNMRNSLKGMQGKEDQFKDAKQLADRQFKSSDKDVKKDEKEENKVLEDLQREKSNMRKLDREVKSAEAKEERAADEVSDLKESIDNKKEKIRELTGKERFLDKTAHKLKKEASRDKGQAEKEEFDATRARDKESDARSKEKIEKEKVNADEARIQDAKRDMTDKQKQLLDANRDLVVDQRNMHDANDEKRNAQRDVANKEKMMTGDAPQAAAAEERAELERKTKNKDQLRAEKERGKAEDDIGTEKGLRDRMKVNRQDAAVDAERARGERAQKIGNEADASRQARNADLERENARGHDKLAKRDLKELGKIRGLEGRKKREAVKSEEGIEKLANDQAKDKNRADIARDKRYRAGANIGIASEKIDADINQVAADRARINKLRVNAGDNTRAASYEELDAGRANARSAQMEARRDQDRRRATSILHNNAVPPSSVYSRGTGIFANSQYA